MVSKSNAWRSFHVKLSDVASRDDYLRVDALYCKLASEFSKLQQDPKFVQAVLANIGEYKTNFVKAMATSYGKPYLDWGVNNCAKYYRIVMTQAHEVMKGLSKKLALAMICEEHGYKCDRSALKEMQDHAFESLGYRPKYREIANICQAGKIPSAPDSVVFELDYTSEDNQICEMIDSSLEHVCFALKVDNGDRAILDVQIPKSCREHVDHYSRPNIIPVTDEQGVIIDYEVMISYEPVIADPPESGGVLGVDLGKIKAASMAALYEDGTVSREHLVTKETQKVLDKLNHVYDETQATMKAISECVDGKHLTVLEKQLAGQRSKLSSLRSSFARLVGRDVCSCALQLGCGEVHLEDLACLIATGAQVTGRWNFAAVKKCIVEACCLCGIKVVMVDPAYTSKTSPFDNSAVVPGSDRLVDCSCCVIDRDYLGALNIARCRSGRCVRSCGVLSFSRNEGVLFLLPVSCILRSRKSKFK